MTIETFLPSEVARLVLGYLAEIGCQRSHETLLSECNDLREYASLLAGGLKFSTKVGGKSLLDILAEYCYLSRQPNPRSVEQPAFSPSASNQPPPNPANSESVPPNAGAVYRAAREVLSSNLSSNASSAGRSSCPPAATTPQMDISPPHVPMTCQVAPPSIDEPSTSSAPLPSRRQTLRQKYGSNATNANGASSSSATTSQPKQSTFKSPPATFRTRASIDLDDESASNSNLTAFSQDDPLAGISSIDPLFDFARTLAENINSVIAKEHKKDDLSFISPEKADQIIEMTEHDPNFDRFVRSLFTDANLPPLGSNETGSTAAAVAAPAPGANPASSRPPTSVGANEEIASDDSNEIGQMPQSTQHFQDQVMSSPQAPSQQTQQFSGASGSATNHVPLIGVRRRRKGNSEQPKKKGRPKGRRDNVQRVRTCKVRDPFMPQPMLMQTQLEPRVREIVQSMPPIAPKVCIPRLPRPPPQQPAQQSLPAMPLSVLFGNNNVAAASGSGGGGYYLMDTGGGNLVMLSLPNGVNSPPKQAFQPATVTLPTRVIISPAEENSVADNPPPSVSAQAMPAPEPPAVSENANAERIDSDANNEVTLAESNTCGNNNNNNNNNTHNNNNNPAAGSTFDAQTMNSTSILDSITFDELFYRSPHRLPQSNGVFGLGSESKLRTPPDDSQTSFLTNFGSLVAGRHQGMNAPAPSSAVKHLMFDDAAPSFNHSDPSVTAIVESLTALSQSVPQTTSWTNDQGIAFQSTADSQAQTNSNGRVLRRIPPIPVPVMSTPEIPPPPPCPTSGVRRTRSNAQRDTGASTSSLAQNNSSSTASSSANSNFGSSKSSAKRRRENSAFD